jgi:hypothetical protein
MKRTLMIAGGVLVLVVLLAGAAFVAGRLLAKAAPQDQAGADLPPMAAPKGAGGGQQVRVMMERAEGLPDRAPDVMGPYSRREDNRIFVTSNGSGTIRMINGQFVNDPDAKELEVVITNETTVYEDVTEKNLGDRSSGTIQQEIEPGSADDIGESSVVSAWGQKTGDRLVADVVVYTAPPVSRR